LNLIHGLLTGVLALALPLVPAAAQAPETYEPDTSSRLYMVGDHGFSYRWVDEETSVAEGLECNLYAWCAFADIVGPSCEDEVLVELDFFDADDWYVTSGVDVLPGAGSQRHIRVELGTNLFDGMASLEVADVRCYLGLPTGTPDL
jgi:hypothetical protein